MAKIEELKSGMQVRFGDREGRINWVLKKSHAPRVQVEHDGCYLLLYPDMVEIVKPPVEVGDKIETADEAESLPNGTAFRERGGCLFEKISGLFYSPRLTTARFADELYYPLTIIDAPKESRND